MPGFPLMMSTSSSPTKVAVADGQERRRQRGLALFAFLGVALLVVAWPSAGVSPGQGRPAAFLLVGPAAATGMRVAPWSRTAAREQVGRNMAITARQTKRRPWVEPTIPQELMDEAGKEGFRLRPKYSHMKIGYVVSDKNEKTRVAHVEYFLFNAKYGAYYKRSKKFHYHDEYEISKLGDVVLIAPYRKTSAMKSYRLIEVMKKNTAPVRV
mmetsp:Transcript_129835/g.277140  ORF Transcript_129835/g.277140 Transcript_129835/m.277140 type:complete len:211 (+) Transcript_129835:104-736(+)